MVDYSSSSNLAILRLIQSHRHPMPRRTHNLCLVELCMPIAPILNPLVLLQ